MGDSGCALPPPNRDLPPKELPPNVIAAEILPARGHRRCDEQIRRRELLAQPRREILPVIAAHGFVGDGAGDFVQPRFERGAALRRVERSLLALALPQHMRQRTRRAEHVRDSVAAAGAGEIVGILAVGQAGEFQALAGLDQRQRDIDGAVGGAAAGAVAVEAQDRLVVEPPHQGELIGGERGAERRDGGLEAGGDHGDDVDIAFDGDDARAPSWAALRAAAML